MCVCDVCVCISKCVPWHVCVGKRCVAFKSQCSLPLSSRDETEVFQLAGQALPPTDSSTRILTIIDKDL